MPECKDLYGTVKMTTGVQMVSGAYIYRISFG